MLAGNKSFASDTRADMALGSVFVILRKTQVSEAYTCIVCNF